jgi:hypothetical protein
VLASLAYGDLALRYSQDLDILIHEQDVARAERVMTEAGFALQRRHSPGEHAYEDSYGRGDGVWVEIHWKLTGLKRLDLRPVWKRMRPVKVFGTSYNFFSPVDLLVFLCLHGAKHRWARMIWICDIAAVLKRQESLDWDELFRVAHRMGGRRALQVGVTLAIQLAGAYVPPEQRARIEGDKASAALVGFIRESLFTNVQPTETFLESWGYQLQFRERPWERAWLSYFFFRYTVARRLTDLPYLAGKLREYGKQPGFIRKIGRSLLGRSI